MVMSAPECLNPRLTLPAVTYCSYFPTLRRPVRCAKYSELRSLERRQRRWLSRQECRYINQTIKALGPAPPFCLSQHIFYTDPTAESKQKAPLPQIRTVQSLRSVSHQNALLPLSADPHAGLGSDDEQR
ncbi:hypothetical protein CBOM_08106 [Ceraceosorus bombacis]|uniref:Uncharacterized protein n=1 Tax=Ceraceosorus bombacis TaxID=401625 RepID=A0A0N7LAK5_9BASI|nr:hypothetical protein CBOM_08106 [Ceraceosorus bombacis]